MCLYTIVSHKTAYETKVWRNFHPICLSVLLSNFFEIYFYLKVIQVQSNLLDFQMKSGNRKYV
jgi:hypothetical protein